MTVLEILDEISNTSGKNDKIDIIRKAGEANIDFKNTLYYAYNPHFVYGVRKFEIGKPLKIAGEGRKLTRIYITFLPQLFNRVLTGNKALKKLNLLTDSMYEGDVEVLVRVLERNLKAGFSIASINKAFPGFINLYKVSLCNGFNEETVKTMPYPVIVQTKEDAMRVHFHVSAKGTVIAKSRSGKMIHIPDSFANKISKLTLGFFNAVVFDGELMTKKDGQILPRKTSNGIVNKCMKGTASEEEMNMLCVKLWDIIPEDDFITGISSLKYKFRLSALKRQIRNANVNGVELVHSVECEDFEQVLFEYEKAMAKNEEGIIIKNPDAPWEGKRTNNQIKLKAEHECDLYIAKCIEGRGRLRGKLGSFYCESSDGLVTVNVGTGFSDAQRDEYFDEEKYVGKVVSIQYADLIKEKEHAYHLYCPVFIEMRSDKVEADCLLEIKGEK